LHLNDDAEPVIDVEDIPAGRKPDAEAAVEACPVRALTVTRRVPNMIVAVASTTRA
jgi:ferredoxin